MKNKYRTIYALILLSFIVTAVFLAFMPDKVPMHYNTAGEINRFGSKYENLLFPFVSASMGAFMAGLAKYEAKKKEAGNEKILLVSGIATLVFFNLIFAFLQYKAASYSPDAVDTFNANATLKLTFIGMGAVLCVLGNIMPKARLNAVFGLRTTWSMKNDRVWQKSQRFGGISMVLCGLAVIVANLFVTGIACVMVTVGLLAVDAIISVIASYYIYKKDGETKEITDTKV